jgi:hypothetical protein
MERQHDPAVGLTDMDPHCPALQIDVFPAHVQRI